MARFGVVGAGLTGVAAAWTLHNMGHSVEIFEATKGVGGQVVTNEYDGVLFDMHGAHIFHTNDGEIWSFVNRFARFTQYRHRVKSSVTIEGQEYLLSWPPQLAEIAALPGGAAIIRDLEKRDRKPNDGNDLESWCRNLYGDILFELFIAGYSIKQWGRPLSTLSAAWAPKRLELRHGGAREYFKDRYQGWPIGGYGMMIGRMLEGIQVSTGRRITINEVLAQRQFQGWVITCALDEFFDNCLGYLKWRGVYVAHSFHPDVANVILPAGTVNYPDPAIPFTRKYETKWMSGQRIRGTVLSTEYPVSGIKHYPVIDRCGANIALARGYQFLLTSEFDTLVVPAGRLAKFAYINMDQAIRQGINAARRLTTHLAEELI